jgi:hypothetical protein
MLRMCRFGGKYCSWIAYWISSVHFLVLVNSFATSFFIGSRGLRQGDPLSPFLFVILMVALGRMISAAVSGGLLSNFYVGTKTNISHMLFVYDTLLFCGADPNHLRNLWSLFLCYEVVSGLKMNLAKSELVYVRNVDNVVGLTGILSCGVTSLPLKYLGLPLGASYKAEHILDSVIEKIERW